MKKFAKTILTISVLILTLFTIFNYSFAVNTTTENTTQSQQSSSQPTSQITTTVSSTTSADEGLLSATNIINILLIAVGIVIIFLAIAILTRLKK